MVFANRAARRTVRLLLPLAILSQIGVSQQGSSTSSSAREVHIAVQLRQLSGDPLEDRLAKDFHVFAHRTSFAVILARPSAKPTGSHPVLTRLLLLAPPSRSSNDIALTSSLLAQLRPLWRRGWLIAALTPEGCLTPYVSSGAALRDVIDHASLQRSPIQAIGGLQSFPGRRLVISIADPHKFTSYALIQASQHVQAMLYDVGADLYEKLQHRQHRTLHRALAARLRCKPRRQLPSPPNWRL